MASDARRFLVIGASLAGAKAAETLRSEGFEGRVVLLGEESIRPYERPALSKGYLQGSTTEDKLYVHEPDFYRSHDIELRLATHVQALDTDQKAVVVDSGERIPYDAVLLTTGATPRRLMVPGADLPGVHYLRDLEDANRLRQAIARANHVVVIGAGWIGCEVAASARQLGADVAMVEAGRLPLVRVLGQELGEFYRDLHRERGVKLFFEAQVEALRGTDHVESVHLGDGTNLAADVVVVGVGVDPRTELAEGAGLALQNGVVTDEYLATSVANVWAAGDIANAWHPLFARRIRLEHWSSALHQGPVAARNMLGAAVSYDRVPYFFSDQYDVGMEYSGYAPDWDEVIFRGDVSKREFVAFWLKENRLLAGMNVNVWGVSDTIAALVASGAPLDPNALANPNVELSTLVSEHRGNE